MIDESLASEDRNYENYDSYEFDDGLELTETDLE